MDFSTEPLADRSAVILRLVLLLLLFYCNFVPSMMWTCFGKSAPARSF